MNPFYKNLALWMVIGLIVILLFTVSAAIAAGRDRLLRLPQEGRVGRGARGHPPGQLVTGKLKTAQSFRTFTADYPDLVKSLKDKGVKIEVKPPDTTRGTPSCCSGSRCCCSSACGSSSCARCRAAAPRRCPSARRAPG